MELTKIEIRNYKSIKAPITISFSENMPVVLIGKNGSGKTNILEALDAIVQANAKYPRVWRSNDLKDLRYCAYVKLSKNDIDSLLPGIVYDETKSEIAAYGDGQQLKIDTIRSENIVPQLKKRVVDVRELLVKLQHALDVYEKQLQKISHSGWDEAPIGCYRVEREGGALTNYQYLKSQTASTIAATRQNLENALKAYDDTDDSILRFAEAAPDFWGWSHLECFRLKYVEPELASFETKYVTINKKAIKSAITKINRATEESCQTIENLIRSIDERAKQIERDIFNTYDNYYADDERYGSFVQQLRQVVGRRCQFLKSENQYTTFGEPRVQEYVSGYSYAILETYLRQVYQGEDRDEFLQNISAVTLSGQQIKQFEVFLNDHVPEFDHNMYEKILVRADGKEKLSIILKEKTGEEVDLNHTSAGRRWYFAYYFMKNILQAGDVFLIDEPAATLHPSAQREVLHDLIELTKRGIKIVFSTHSPYLVPNVWQSVHFVSMNKGTKVSKFDMNSEDFKSFRACSPMDIFTYEEISDYYAASKFQGNVTKGIYKKLIKCYPTNTEIAKLLDVKERTIYYWQNAEKVISLKNIIKIAHLLQTDPLTLIKETE